MALQVFFRLTPLYIYIFLFVCHGSFDLSKHPICTTLFEGNFIVRVNGNIIWDRRDPNTPGFPEVKQIKQLVRDMVDPTINLGHSDKKVIEIPEDR